MKQRISFSLVVLIALVLVAGNGASAQGPKPGPRSATSTLGNGFTYPGLLKNGLTFLFDRGARTAKISGVPTQSGTFTVKVSAWCLGTSISGQTGDKTLH